MFEFMNTIKAVADNNRVRIISILQGRELCVCQLIKMLNLAPSTVSKHISILRQARLIEDRKEGRWMYYRLPDSPSPLAKDLITLINNSITNDQKIIHDNQTMEEILSISKEDLCQTTN